MQAFMARSDIFLGALLLGRLLVLLTNIKPNLKYFPGTNALAFLVNWWAYLSGSPIRCSPLGVVFTKLHFLLNLWFGPIRKCLMTLEERLAKDKLMVIVPISSYEETKMLWMWPLFLYPNIRPSWKCLPMNDQAFWPVQRWRRKPFYNMFTRPT